MFLPLVGYFRAFGRCFPPSLYESLLLSICCFVFWFASFSSNLRIFPLSLLPPCARSCSSYHSWSSVRLLLRLPFLHQCSFSLIHMILLDQGSTHVPLLALQLPCLILSLPCLLTAERKSKWKVNTTQNMYIPEPFSFAT